MPRQRGRRGAGSIKRLPNGKYRAWFSAGLDGRGRRIRKSATFILRGDADWWLREAQRAGAAPDVDLTVGEYLERWLGSVKPSVRPSTWESYRGHVQDHLVPGLGRIPVTNLQPHHVDAFLAERLKHRSDRTKRPLSPTYVRSILTTLRMALATGVRRRELPDNAAADATAPTVRREPVRAMTFEEADALVDAVRGTWCEQLVRFLLGSGLRVGEATALNQRDVQDGYVQLRRSKTTLRAVPVSDDGMAALREALVAAPRRGPDEPVFFSPRPNHQGVRDRLDRASLTHALPRILETAGLPRVTPHGLRHGTATLLLASGASMRAIAEQLGHANPAMTANVYAHVDPRSLRETVNLLNRRVADR